MNEQLDGYIGNLVDVKGFETDKLGYIRDTRLGIQLLLLMNASKMTDRVMKLRGVLDNVEDKIFDSEAIKQLSEKELLAFYRMVASTSERYMGFVYNLLKDADWANIEGMLLEAEAIRKTDKALPPGNIDALIEEIAKKMGNNKPDGSTLIEQLPSAE